MSMFFRIRKMYNNIRMKSQSQVKYSVLFSAILGIILGFTAKILDSPIMPSVLSILGLIASGWGIWIFICTLLAVYSNTPKLAAIRVFIFLISMLFSYYIYTVSFLGIFPRKYILFWCIMALLSIIPGYIIWFSRGDSLIANVIAALPISIIALEGYIIYVSTVNFYEKYRGYENVLVSKGDYWFMVSTEIFYSLLVLIILFLIPKRKKQWLYIIPFSIVVFLVLAAVIPSYIVA